MSVDSTPVGGGPEGTGLSGFVDVSVEIEPEPPESSLPPERAIRTTATTTTSTTAAPIRTLAAWGERCMGRSGYRRRLGQVGQRRLHLRLGELEVGELAA